MRAAKALRRLPSLGSHNLRGVVGEEERWSIQTNSLRSVHQDSETTGKQTTGKQTTGKQTRA